MSATGYFVYHRDMEQSCGSAFIERVRGLVLRVRVLLENQKSAHVEFVDHPGERGLIAKWPLKHWGKARGIFNTAEEAAAYASRPLPRFDHDGELI